MFRGVALPLVVPGLIAAGVVAFVFAGTNSPWCSTLTTRAAATVPVGIAHSLEQYEIQKGPMAAASMLATVPACS